MSNGDIHKDKKGKNTWYSLAGGQVVQGYFDQPYFERKPVSYDARLLDSYIPNATSFL